MYAYIFSFSRWDFDEVICARDITKGDGKRMLELKALNRERMCVLQKETSYKV